MHVSLAEQSLEVQLQASDGGVQRVELAARLPSSPRPLHAIAPRLRLKVPVEVVAALHLAEAASQRLLKRLRHGGDGPVQQRQCRRGGRRSEPLRLAGSLLHPLGRQQEGQPAETLGALAHPQLEEHLEMGGTTIRRTNQSPWLFLQGYYSFTKTKFQKLRCEVFPKPCMNFPRPNCNYSKQHLYTLLMHFP